MPQKRSAACDGRSPHASSPSLCPGFACLAAHRTDRDCHSIGQPQRILVNSMASYQLNGYACVLIFCLFQQVVREHQVVKVAQKRGATGERRGAGEAPWYHQESRQMGLFDRIRMGMQTLLQPSVAVMKKRSAKALAGYTTSHMTKLQRAQLKAQQKWLPNK